MDWVTDAAEPYTANGRRPAADSRRPKTDRRPTTDNRGALEVKPYKTQNLGGPGIAKGLGTGSGFRVCCCMVHGFKIQGLGFGVRV